VGSLSLLAGIDFLLLLFEFLDDVLQLGKACIPELAVPVEPCRLFLESARAELARPHASYLFRGDEPGLLQDADVLLHACEGHVELRGKLGDRRVAASQLLQNAASGGIRERGERGVKTGVQMLNHMVQYCTSAAEMQWGQGVVDRDFGCRAGKLSRTNIEWPEAGQFQATAS
jgi:hypothetical protein